MRFYENQKGEEASPVNHFIKYINEEVAENVTFVAVLYSSSSEFAYMGSLVVENHDF